MKTQWKCQQPHEDPICLDCRHALEHDEETGCHRKCGPFEKVCVEVERVVPIKKNGNNGKPKAKPAEILDEIEATFDKLAEEADEGVSA